MAVDVYWGSGSPFAWRVLLTLELKQVPYKSHLLEFSKREHKSREMLAMNPRGKVPVLRDADVVLYESLGIMTYLDRKHPAPPIFGRTPEEAGRIMQRVSELTSYLIEPSRDVPRAVQRGKVEEDLDALQFAVDAFQAELLIIEQRLATDQWLAGNAVSAADIVLVPALQSVLRAAPKETAAALRFELLPFAERFPGLARWCGQMEALPGYDRAYPPHWRS